MPKKPDDHDEIARILCGNLRTARMARYMDPEVLAKTIGMSTEYYSRIEDGQQICGVEPLRAIADILDVSVDTLLGEAITRRSLTALDLLPDDDRRDLARRIIAMGHETISFMSRVMDYRARREADKGPGDDET